MRAFVAIELPGFRSPPGGIRSGDPAPAHLTLRFLGEVPAAQLPSISAALRTVAAGARPFPLTVQGIGAFPSPDRPRIVFVGVTEGRDEVGTIARAIDGALAPLGRPPDPRPFVPHVTLFRVRSRRDAETARWLLAAPPGPPGFAGRVEAIVLVESVLRPSGAQHTVRERFSLGSPDGPDRSDRPPSIPPVDRR